MHLVELEARVRGAPPMDDDGPLLALDRAALARWRVGEAEGAVRFESGVLAGDGLAGVGRLVLRLEPGGARSVSIVPHARGAQLDREHRVLRSLETTLEPGREDEPVDVAIDLHEALYATFGDGARGGRLTKLEVALPGADPERAALVSLVVEGRRRLPPGRAAAAGIAEHRGVLRPSWVVRGGAEVEIALRLPDRPAELRFSDAAVPGTGPRSATLVHAGVETRLAERPAADAEREPPWTPVRADLSPWAGESVRIRLRVDGEGVGLFGDPAVVTPEPERATPDVVVYLVDTLRADHLGVGGSATAGVSPEVDRLAREGVWFARAQSSSPWTKPAVATLMSAVLPTTHRVGATSYTDRMPSGVPLLQERFRAAGWRAGSFSASPLGSTLSALERGFEAAYPPRYWRERPRLASNPSADQLHRALLAWVDEQPDRPFFAYVHTLEVHEWKQPRDPQQPGSRAADAYDAAVRDADRRLGELVRALEERGRPFLLVLTSDHGESWGDHGLPSHGFGLYQSQIHIPLLFYHSQGLGPAVVPDPVSLADLAPTLLDGFGLPALAEADGRSLLAALAGGALPERPVLSALLRFVWAPHAPRQYALTTPDRRVLIRREGDEGTEVFDLVVDPQELRPLPDPTPDLARALDAELERQARRAAAYRERYGPVRTAPVTPDETARLRALGYLGDSAETP